MTHTLTLAGLQNQFSEAFFSSVELRPDDDCFKVILPLVQPKARDKDGKEEPKIMRNLYGVSQSTPIETSGNDEFCKNSLKAILKLRISNAAVTELLIIRDQLKRHVAVTQAHEAHPPMLGIASHVVQATYLEHTLAFGLETPTVGVSRIYSASQACDLLANQVKTMADVLYTSSNCAVVNDVGLEPAHPQRPLLIIGGDPILVAMLNSSGGLDSLDHLHRFDVKTVQTCDLRMCGKLFLTFNLPYPKACKDRRTQCNPLSFGSMVHYSALVEEFEYKRNDNNTGTGLTTSPCYRHVNHLPVLGEITVTGINSLFQTKA
jgi:hypothetical protein